MASFVYAFFIASNFVLLIAIISVIVEWNYWRRFDGAANMRRKIEARRKDMGIL